MNGLPTSFVDKDGLLHELKLHVGKYYLRVYEYVTVGRAGRSKGACMVLGRPIVKVLNTDDHRHLLYALYPDLQIPAGSAATA